MKKAYLIYIALSLTTYFCTAQTKKLDNTFYAFNNAVRTLPNAPQGMEEQAQLIKELGFDGLSGHHSEDYFARRAALDKVGLAMPEIYLPITINADGSGTLKEDIYDIIKDSKDRNLVVALAAFSKAFENNKTEGDKHLVKAIQDLADFAAPYGAKIAVYPHVGFYCERLDHSIALAKAVNRPNVGAIFNTCHLFKVEGTEGWEEKLRNAVPYLFMISLNGLDSGDTQKMNWDQLIQPLGEGSFDTYQIVKVAKDAGYEGLFGLQCYKINQDCRTALTKSISTWHAYQKKYSQE